MTWRSVLSPGRYRNPLAMAPLRLLGRRALPQPDAVAAVAQLAFPGQIIDDRADGLFEERAGAVEAEDGADLLDELWPGEAEPRAEHREDGLGVLFRRDPVGRDARAVPGAQPARAVRAAVEVSTPPDGPFALHPVAGLLEAGLDARAHPGAPLAGHAREEVGGMDRPLVRHHLGDGARELAPGRVQDVSAREPALSRSQGVGSRHGALIGLSRRPLRRPLRSPLRNKGGLQESALRILPVPRRRLL